MFLIKYTWQYLFERKYKIMKIRKKNIFIKPNQPKLYQLFFNEIKLRSAQKLITCTWHKQKKNHLFFKKVLLLFFNEKKLRSVISSFVFSRCLLMGNFLEGSGPIRL